MKMQFVLVMSMVFCCGPAARGADPVDVPNGMGIFFSDAEFTDETTNSNATSSINAYLVLINADMAAVSGYRCGIQYPDSIVLQINSGSQTHGWHNSGSPTNHIVTFTQQPKPVGPDATVVLCTLVLYSFGTDMKELKLGPSLPRGLVGWNGPVVIGPELDDERPAFLTSGISGEGFQTVATFWGDGVTAAEVRTLTQVKSLFR